MGVVFKNKNWYIDYRLPDGKRRREKIGKNKKTAKLALAKRKVEIAEGKYINKPMANKIMFEVFADEYLELHCKVNNIKSWSTGDKHNIKRLKEFFSGTYIDDITPHLIEQFKAKRYKEVAPATVNRQLACLKCMFSKAVQWGKYYGDNPVKKVKLFKENNQRLRFLEKDEIEQLLNNCHTYIRPIVIVALNTGMRKGEIMGLKWRDVDFKRNIIHLLDTKNGDKRDIPMNDQVKNTLIAIRKSPKTNLIFTKPDGNPYKNINNSFLKALDKSGIKGFRFHDLRHTFASHLVMNNVDLNTVRELLGHKSLTMTLRYAHLSPNHKKLAVDVLGKKMDTFWTPRENENIKNDSKLSESIA